MVKAFDAPAEGLGFTTVIFNMPVVDRSAAGMVAVIWVPILLVGVIIETPSFTIAPVTKFVPVKVIGVAVLRIAVVGLMFVSVGAGLLTIKLSEDMPPPGPGLVTATATDPAVVRSAAGIVAVICVEFTKVEETDEPPMVTVAVLRKFEPFKVIGVAPLPTIADVGTRLLNVGVRVVDQRWSGHSTRRRRESD